MHKILLAAALLIISINTQAQTQIDSMESGGRMRNYRIHFPPNFSNSEKLPLVLNLHGLGSNAFQQEFYSDFSATSDTGRFIVVYPNAVNGTWNTAFGLNNTIDDVAFLSALIDTINTRYNTDSRRVYSTGMSLGGFMTFRLACELSGKLAAIASVTGSISRKNSLLCDPARALPMMQFHGTNDQTVTYYDDNSPFYISCDSLVRYWKGRKQCSAPTITKLADTDKTDSCTVTKFDYTDCTDGTVYIHYRIDSGEHTWPGSPFGGVGTNQDISATNLIWNFFKQYSADPILSTSSVLPKAKGISVYPNPASTELMIESSSAIQQITITDLLGRIIVTKNTNNETQIKLELGTNLPAGIYLVTVTNNLGNEVFKVVKE